MMELTPRKRCRLPTCAGASSGGCRAAEALVLLALVAALVRPAGSRASDCE
jgi:hypothetical protein